MLILPDGPRPLPSPSACYYCVAGCVCGHGVQGHKAGLLHYAAPDYVLDKKPQHLRPRPLQMMHCNKLKEGWNGLAP